MLPVTAVHHGRLWEWRIQPMHDVVPKKKPKIQRRSHSMIHTPSPVRRSALMASTVRRSALMASTVRRSAIMASTGEHAPVSGWWRPNEQPMPFRYLQEGNIMPPVEGSGILWVLVHGLPPSDRVRISLGV